MKKFQLLGVALVAVFAFGVVLAAQASAAVTFLLAEWLANGTALAEGAQLGTETVGTILLEDTKTLLGASAVECSGILLGTAGFDGLGVVSEVLSLALAAISSTPLSGTALECTELKVCEEALVWPLHLPWSTLVELMEDTGGPFFVVLLEEGESKAGTPGWEVECMKTITKPVDECTATGIINLTLESTLLLGMFSDTFTELAELSLATCTQSKETTGIVETIPTPLSLTNGETLSASSESIEA
jgi:hypothetical protein